MAYPTVPSEAVSLTKIEPRTPIPHEVRETLYSSYLCIGHEMLPATTTVGQWRSWWGVEGGGMSSRRSRIGSRAREAEGGQDSPLPRLLLHGKQRTIVLPLSLKPVAGSYSGLSEKREGVRKGLNVSHRIERLTPVLGTLSTPLSALSIVSTPEVCCMEAHRW